MTVLSAERGYGSVTVRDLVAMAKVSSRAFYEQYGGKEDCLLAAHEFVIRRAAKRIVASQAGERDWLERLRLAFHAAVREVEREPASARLALVEMYCAGPAAREQARRAELSFEAMLTDSFDRAADGLGAPPLAVEGIVAGAAAILRRGLVSDEGLSNQTADDLLDWALALRRRVAGYVPSSDPVRISSSKAASRSRSNMSDRDLILAAVAKLVAADELERVTVKRIHSAAGMTRQRFDAHFASVEDCVSAAAQQRIEEAIGCAVRAQAAGGNGQVQTEEAIIAFCGAFTCESALAKLCATDTRIAEQINSGIGGILVGDPVSEPQPMPLHIEATAAMVWGVIRNRICTGNQGGLCRIAPMLAAAASDCDPASSWASRGGRN